MTNKTSFELERQISAQYARMLRLAVTSDWVCTPLQQRLLRRGILSRYIDLVALGRKAEADRLMAWSAAEKRAWRERNESKAA